MNKQANVIPNEIFEWLETYDFEQLNPQQQQLVLQVLESEDSYTAMRDTILSLKVVSAPREYPETASKDKLLKHFQTANHGSQHSPNKVIRYWQAAAILLLMTSIALSVYKRKPLEEHYASVIRDTIEVIRYVDRIPAIVHDTLFLDPEKHKENNTRKQSLAHQGLQEKQNKLPKEKSAPAPAALPGGMAIVSIDDYNKRANTQKGMSIKDDSLIQQHEFVSL